MKTVLLKLFTGLALASALGACSSDADDLANAFGDGSGKFGGKPVIEGPEVEGRWLSGCFYNYFSTYAVIEINFTGNKFVRTKTTFDNSSCSLNPNVREHKGTFAFVGKYDDGSYEISYGIDLGNGWTQYLDEKLLKDGNEIYVSEFSVGEDAELLSMPLIKQDESVMVQ